MGFMWGKYKRKERLFEKDPILKACYEAFTLSGHHRRKKKNIMSHDQYIENLRISDDLYQTDNIEGWKLSKEPKLLQGLNKIFPAKVERAKVHTYNK